MYQPRTMTIPEIQPELKAYWDAAAEDKLLIKQCDDCGQYHYYPRLLCPFCMSEKTSWREAKGTGTIYTYSVMRREVPYAIAFVTLDEGPRMMTNIVDCDLDTLQIEQRVKVVFKPSGDQDQPGPSVPCFTPAYLD
ncbi:Zn-ribbon domain-containing OB-fold protein [Paenibacillus thalictri]|nr:Zn-ribbon domain-containing OB-fold protein [Paenibacillus thalictri]